MDNTQVFYPRRLETRIVEAMADTPVVLVAGPRQAGKTTLVRQIAAQEMRYLTLDDELTLLAAKEDPVGLIRSLEGGNFVNRPEQAVFFTGLLNLQPACTFALGVDFQFGALPVGFGDGFPTGAIG